MGNRAARNAGSSPLIALSIRALPRSISSNHGVTGNSDETCDMLPTFKVELENPSHSKFTTEFQSRPPTRAGSKASTIIETTTGTFKQSSVLNAPIFTERVFTDEYMVLNGCNHFLKDHDCAD